MSKYFLQYPKSAFKKARSLRKKMTQVERKLWSLLRKDKLGVHFRKQVPFGPYVLDFACLEPKIVIELDGNQHASALNMLHDSKRDIYLREKGFAVLRFSDTEFLTNPEGVVNVIYESIPRVSEKA